MAEHTTESLLARAAELEERIKALPRSEQLRVAADLLDRGQEAYAEMVIRHIARTAPGAVDV